MLNEFIGLTAVMGGITEERHHLEAQPRGSGNLGAFLGLGIHPCASGYHFDTVQVIDY